ncbi:TetR/AcrR family transcriptional regulator [Thermobifida halotolerans]|uniref:TetR/AcrR family transcriptional regulator n=2 Tax=Thermobifida halotolerans TaxID=483545 RepID=A0AA97M296_9ACTN|nr:TetR/AcrR family transcriptional regulator [Thermobifida halotolerans]UOE22005.1 TetR/AcrR family transcriptional regulator [Thermobifida halotolerans]
MREATFAEIKAIARRHLVDHGPEGVSLRAIAREMGMTAPALYRYFSSLNDLLLSLQADLFAELSAHITDASAQVPDDDVDGRVLTSLRAFRSWARTNRAEFALLFGPRGPHHLSGPHEGVALREGQRFAATFLTLFDRLLAEDRVPLPDSASFSPELRRQLDLFAECAGFGGENATEGALRVLTACWVRLYGLVCMEVFQNMAFAVDDMEPLFEAELRDLLTSIGVRYRPPGR